MKKIILSFMAGILFTAILSWKNESNLPNTDKPNPDTRSILALRKIKLKDAVSAEAFEKFAIRVGNNEFGKIPGVNFYFGKGERGDEPNSYVLFMDFDSKTTRDFYAPSEDDDTKRSAEAAKMVNEYFVKYNTEFIKFAEVVTPAGKKGYVDYIILK